MCILLAGAVVGDVECVSVITADKLRGKIRTLENNVPIRRVNTIIVPSCIHTMADVKTSSATGIVDVERGKFKVVCEM